MVAVILFFIGVIAAPLMSCWALTTPPGVDLKIGLIAFPFLMFLGAAVARYLGL